MEVGSPFDGEAMRQEPAGTPNVTHEEIERWLIERISNLISLDADAIVVDRPFADFALDSALVISITNELSRWLGREISVTAFWEFPTIEELANNLVSA